MILNLYISEILHQLPEVILFLQKLKYGAPRKDISPAPPKRNKGKIHC